MRNLILLGLSIILLATVSCRMDFSTEPSQGNLEFSKDTVYLDTVFTNIGSSTYRLKVYNRTDQAVTIPSIRLGRGSNSGYRLNVDGLPGQSFENIDILAQDSIFVFIETTLDYTEITEPLYIDDLLFDSGVNEQVVKLVTLVQDAHFLYPNKTNGIIETLTLDGEETELQGRYLNDVELTFNDDKPYVVYGYMVVGTTDNQAKTLVMQAGTKVHFHANSGLIINPNSSLHIQGSINVEGQPETEVVLEGDRLEPEYSDIPGQWGVIWLRNGSIHNQINYATIKNGSIGLLVDGYTSTTIPTLDIKNTQLYNFAQFGIFARLSNLNGKNLVFNNFGYSAFAGTQGGYYEFTHCTFANYWNGSVRSYPTVLVNNFYTEDQVNFIPFDLQKASFTNCIIYGNNNIEMKLEKVDTGIFNYNFTNNLIRFNDTGNQYSSKPQYNFTDTTHYTGNIFNQTPDFKTEFISLNQMFIGQNSAGKAHAAVSGTTLVPLDILGKTRANPADIGAYEFVVFE